METNKDMVVDVLSNYGAMTSHQIAIQVNLKHGVILTASQVSGAMRPLISKGEIASSRDEHGKRRYWMAEREF